MALADGNSSHLPHEQPSPFTSVPFAPACEAGKVRVRAEFGNWRGWVMGCVRRGGGGERGGGRGAGGRKLVRTGGGSGQAAAFHIRSVRWQSTRWLARRPRRSSPCTS